MRLPVTRSSLLVAIAALLAAGCADEEALSLGGPASGAGWSQWGMDARHHGKLAIVGQAPEKIFADIPLDPFIAQEIAEASDDDERALLVHYQAPLIAGPDVYMQTKGGSFTSCDPPGSGEPAPCGVDAWGTEEWRETKWTWNGQSLERSWTFPSDWHPPPNGWNIGGWEPVFHAALAGAYLLVPGAGGAIWAVDRSTGVVIARVDPFHGEAPERTYVAGPITVTTGGDVYYHAIRLPPLPEKTGAAGEPSTPWDLDIEGAWLVHVAPDGTPRTVSFADLVETAPSAGATCPAGFGASELPWPPAPDADAGTVTCGSQRPGLNVAPAVGEDGTIFTVSRAHFAGRTSYVIAVSPDLTPKWSVSLAGHLKDGCGTDTLPPTGEPGGCAEGATMGVDPSTNRPPAGIVNDTSTASPVATPDGGVLYGAYTRYNYARGHLFRFTAEGQFAGAYGFGWDITPAIHEHEGGYSIVIKENHYGTGSYCNDPDVCAPVEEGPFYLTQLSSDMSVEWQYRLANDKSCLRHEDGSVTCVADHPEGFEWCINAPAIDANGTVYANGEDGVVYAVPQGGGEAATLFLGESLGAAYTPIAIDGEGRIYAQNVGRLFVVGKN